MLANPFGIKSNMYVARGIGVDGELLAFCVKVSEHKVPSLLLTLH